MTSFAFPFMGKNGDKPQPIQDDQVFYDLLRNQDSGNYLVSQNGFWHGGIHFGDSAPAAVDIAAGARCIADGQVVAYRLNNAYPHTVVKKDGQEAQTPYSTGFALVRHELEMPKPDTPPAQPAAPGATPANQPPPAPPKKQVFFSLYMHLQSLDEYIAADAASPDKHKRPRPTFWQKAYTVSEHAKDKQQGHGKETHRHKDLPPIPSGAGVHKTSAAGHWLGILPVGTEIMVKGSVKHHYVQIAEILGGGTPIPAVVGGTPDAAIGNGWIDMRSLTPTDNPKSRPLLDEVVILHEPASINAGDLVGYLGKYHWHTSPETETRMVHIELFADDSLKDFIADSRKIAAKLKPETCTILKTGTPVILYDRHDAASTDHIATGTPLALAGQDTNTEMPYVQVKAGVSALWIARSDWSTATKNHHKAQSDLDAWKAYPTSFTAPAQPATHTTGVNQYNLLGLLNAKSADIGAFDSTGKRWWKVKSALNGTQNYQDIEGWVASRQHPGGGNVTVEHPGDWIDFEFVDGGAGDTYSIFSDTASHKIWRASPYAAMGALGLLAPVFQKAYKYLIPQGAGEHAAGDLSQASKANAWLLKRMARGIAKHDSEWTQTGQSKWQKMKSLLSSPEHNALWDQELARHQQLAWWEKVTGKVEHFPSSTSVYHMHPIAVVGNFMTKPAHPVILINGERVELEFLEMADSEVIDDSDYAQAAEMLGCEAAAIKAVSITETGPTGSFYHFSGWDAVPAILFERHHFHKYTHSLFDTQYPDISNGTAGGYGAYSAQYSKLWRAYELDKSAALKSASWGKFQILGSNFASAGYSNVEEFVKDMSRSEKNHIKAFVNFIRSDATLKQAIVNKDWLSFATAYNGQQQHGYDEKMRDNYNAIKNNAH